jgi:hypothetical protein
MPRGEAQLHFDAGTALGGDRGTTQDGGRMPVKSGRRTGQAMRRSREQLRQLQLDRVPH